MTTLILVIIADYAMYKVVLISAPAFSKGFGKDAEVSLLVRFKIASSSIDS